jgi:hypothetical protein
VCTVLYGSLGEVKLRHDPLCKLLKGKLGIGIQIKTPDNSNDMLVACWDSHLKVQKTFKVLMVDVLISPVIYLFEEFLYVIIVTSSNFLLDDFLRACKLEFLMHQL